RRPRAVTPLLVVVLATGLAGCVSRADLLRQDRYMRAAVAEQQRQLKLVQREVERLRATMEEGGAPVRSGGGSSVGGLEARLARLEAEVGGRGATAGVTGTSTDQSTETGAVTEETETEVAVIEEPTPPPVTESPDEWRREVQQEQAAAGAADTPE